MTLRHALLPLLVAAALPAAAQTAPRGLQPQELVTLDRFSSPLLTPDGRTLVYARRVVDMGANKASTALWARDVGAREGAARRLTPDGWNVNSPEISPDGRTVYFLSAKPGSMQLHAVPVTGSEPVQLTAFPVDVGGFDISPDGRRVVVQMETFADCVADLACTKARLDAKEADKRSGVIHDRLFVRHWDTWMDGRLNRLFVADLPAAGKTVSAATLVGGNVIGDVPSRPFGDDSEYVWAPDSRTIAFSARPADRTEPWSTNFDIYLAPAAGGDARNVTAANKAWDAVGEFSPDGRKLYYRAMKRPGFEADRFAITELDLASGATREVAPAWDRSADGVSVSADGRTIYTTATSVGEHPLFAVDVRTGAVREVVGDGSVSSFDIENGVLAFSRNSLRSGDQLFVGGLRGTPPVAMTPSASELLPGTRFGDYEQFSFPGWNGETVHGYVVKPWNYEPGKKYPVAFLIHGGPQGSFGDGWSYRWNPQTYAGQGYAVVMIDFHGSTGYGQAFTDSISQHWGDRPLEDLQKGWAAAQQKYSFLDADRACALGASYGGYMVNWIASQWKEPWKCLVNHNGVFDTRSMGLVTEELWFTEHEFGGPVHEVPENYERFNPARHIGNWSVPMLVVAGQNDFRVPIDQSLSTFTALQRQGVESKLLYFPDENHWVLKPENSVQWHETVNDWLASYLRQ